MRPFTQLLRKKVLTIFITFSVLFFGFLFYSIYQIFTPITPFPSEKTFAISPDENGTQIFTNLQKEGFIRSVFWAKVVAKLTNKNKFFKGEYAFEKPMSVYMVLKEITTRPVSLAVLIPEGFTEKQVADRLAKYIVNFDKNDFLLKADEGYLFPETYFFFKFSTVDEILKEFSNKYNKEMLENFTRLPTKNEMIIASMLEREAKDPKDMKIISGIIQNRLKVGMPLQIDAAVQYGNGVWKSRVLYKDLKSPSDYNTYLNTGLPPGPISNPGINAIRAAMFPEKSKYFYYLTGKDGKMYYGVTHDDHITNKLKYMR